MAWIHRPFEKRWLRSLLLMADVSATSSFVVRPNPAIQQTGYSIPHLFPYYNRQEQSLASVNTAGVRVASHTFVASEYISDRLLFCGHCTTRRKTHRIVREYLHRIAIHISHFTDVRALAVRCRGEKSMRKVNQSTAAHPDHRQPK